MLKNLDLIKNIYTFAPTFQKKKYEKIRFYVLFCIDDK